MPPSMHRLSIAEQRRISRDTDKADFRSNVVRLLQSGQHSLLKISNITGVPTTTSHAIKFYLDRQDSEGLQNLLNPSQNRAGRRPNLTPEQERMIVERLIFAGRRGFAAEVIDLKRIMATIATLNNRPYKNNLPSDDCVRYFRARNRDLAFRNYEAKDRAKIKGESFEHVDGFFKIIEDIGALGGQNCQKL